MFGDKAHDLSMEFINWLRWLWETGKNDFVGSILAALAIWLIRAALGKKETQKKHEQLIKTHRDALEEVFDFDQKTIKKLLSAKDIRNAIIKQFSAERLWENIERELARIDVHDASEKKEHFIDSINRRIPESVLTPRVE